jgi:HEAT repeat protein
MNNDIDNSLNETESAKSNQAKPSLEDVITSIQSHTEGDTLPQEVYYGLSDITSDQLLQFKSFWETLGSDYRLQIVSALAEASETNFEFEYRDFGLFTLRDVESRVREASIKLLWIDESTEFAEYLVHICQNDDDPTVRAAACSELGRFILLGEYEEIPETLANQIQEAVIGIWMDTTEVVEVRRRALEAISNSGHPMLKTAIEDAYTSDEHLLKVSAVFAMGRSLDQSWRPMILKELDNPDAELRFEAARAAGELELKQSVSQLGRIALTDDREIQEVAIWSLGEIGGTQATRILEDLSAEAEDADDDELLEVVEDALGSARMAEFGFDIDDSEEDD